MPTKRQMTLTCLALGLTSFFTVLAYACTAQNAWWTSTPGVCFQVNGTPINTPQPLPELFWIDESEEMSTLIDWDVVPVRRGFLLWASPTGDPDYEYQYFANDSIASIDNGEQLFLEFNVDQWNIWEVAGPPAGGQSRREGQILYCRIHQVEDGFGPAEVRNWAVYKLLLTKPGDANLDGNVSLADLQIVATNWNCPVDPQQGDGWLQGDFNGDGRVSQPDLDILGDYWGT